jgi:putative NIF3 family GTP cyclohydrolase 1 type 2
LFCLDLTHESVDYAIGKECGIIVTHHPAIYSPIKRLNEKNPLLRCAINSISVISMHLNLDGAKSGIDYFFSEGLGGKNATVLMELDGGGYGRTFNFNGTFKDFINNYEKTFDSNKYFAYGNSNRVIKTVSSFCGAGFGEEEYFLSENSDLIVSADIPHHLILKVVESGRCVLQVTHYASEIYGFKKFYDNVEFANKAFVTQEIYK